MISLNLLFHRIINTKHNIRPISDPRVSVWDQINVKAKTRTSVSRMRYIFWVLFWKIVYVKSIITVIIIFAYVIAEDDDPWYLPANIDASVAKINLMIIPRLDTKAKWTKKCELIGFLVK